MKKLYLIIMLVIVSLFAANLCYAFEIVGVGSGRCVDIGAPAGIGAQAQLWDCHGIFNQVFKLLPNGHFQGPNFLYLDAYSPSNGTVVKVNTFYDDNYQRWRIDQYGRIVHIASNRCLDARGGGTVNGTILQLWDCHSGTNQQWVIQK